MYRGGLTNFSHLAGGENTQLSLHLEYSLTVKNVGLFIALQKSAPFLQPLKIYFLAALRPAYFLPSLQGYLYLFKYLHAHSLPVIMIKSFNLALLPWWRDGHNLSTQPKVGNFE